MTKAQLSEWIPDYSGVLMLTTSRRPIWSANAKEPVALFDYSEEEWSEIEAAPFRYRGRGATQRLWSSMLPVGDGTARFLSQQRGELTMPCIVCQRQDATSMSGDGDFTRFDCRRCGAFVLSGTAVVFASTIGKETFAAFSDESHLAKHAATGQQNS